MVWKVSFGPTEHHTVDGVRVPTREMEQPQVRSAGLWWEGGVCRAGGCARIPGWNLGSPWGEEGVVPLTTPELGWQSQLSHAGLLPWLCPASPSEDKGQR